MQAAYQLAARLFARLPANVRTAILGFLSTAWGTTVRKWDDVASYVSRNPLATAVVTEAFLRAGVSNADFVNAVRSGDGGDQLLESVKMLRQKSVKHADSQALGLLSDDQEDDLARARERQRHGRVLVNHFGSLRHAREVRLALTTLTDADYEFLENIGLNS